MIILTPGPGTSGGQVLDTDILREIQFHLVEDVDGGITWSSGLWTVNEVISYLNQRQYTMLKETGILMKRSDLLPINPGDIRRSVPPDLIATQRVVWKSNDATPVYTEIPRSDLFEADHGFPSWQGTPGIRPKGYTDGDQATLLIGIYPVTSLAGNLQLLYVFLSAVLSNSGISVTVPDEFVPGLKYGVMADMLSKDGRGKDPQRAEYCEARYKETIEAGKLILRGWI